MLSYKQGVYHTNLTDTTKFNDNIDIIINSLEKGDVDLIKHLHSKIITPNEIRLNVIKNILKSNIIVKNNIMDIKKFFSLLNPLNNEWNLGSEIWNFKIYKNELFIQNNCLNKNLCPLFYEKYINLIKKILEKSDIDFKYKEFVNERYYNITDLVFRISFI